MNFFNNSEITGNYFYDPDYNQKVDFIYGNNSLEFKWWNKTEPIWITAQKQVSIKKLNLALYKILYLCNQGLENCCFVMARQ